MDAGQHQYHHVHHHHQQISVNMDTGGDRFPQWSIQETRDFLLNRAELDPSFMETKRNKGLWEVIATKMKDKGYNRSAEQCKCKWKNLVTRYKVLLLYALCNIFSIVKYNTFISHSVSNINSIIFVYVIYLSIFSFILFDNGFRYP